MRTFLLLALSATATLVAAATSSTEVRAKVEVLRVPNGGIQPEIAVDSAGVAHMVYLAGEPGAANVFYVRTADGGKTFTPAVRVNSQEGSAIAIGTIRGAHVAVGRNGRVHVAWNGSDQAMPKPPVNLKTQRAGMPMLYARSNAAATVFEPQRNLMTRTTNLDGGGSIAVDDGGGVYVAWHAHPVSGEGGEEARRVWIAPSTNDGKTFSAEYPVSEPSTGVCGCCALRIAATRRGELQILYRSATAMVNRDIYSLVSRDRGQTFAGTRLHKWEIGACPMTSMSIVAGGTPLRAWETDGQVYFTADDKMDPKSPPLATNAPTPRRKHPRLAVNKDGTMLLVWAEGTAWARGGSIAWQVFGRDGQPTTTSGSAQGLPVWGFPAALAKPDGTFTILY
jgi:hypothetical protein